MMFWAAEHLSGPRLSTRDKGMKLTNRNFGASQPIPGVRRISGRWFMAEQSSARVEQALQDLQSKVFTTRRAAADALATISITAADYPDVTPAKLAEFEQAIRHAALAAADPAAVKRGLSVKALAPGLAGIVLCGLLTYVLQVQLGGVIWLAATVWLLFWYFRTLAATLRAQSDPARRALALGKDLGILKQ